MAVQVVVFDIGGVLLDWNPRHLYRRVFADEARMEHFLAHVCSPAWNAEQDRGRSFREAVALASEQHPEWGEHIAMYWDRWLEMVSGALDETVEVLAELRANGVRLLGLSNWSAETFPLMRSRYPFLGWFEGILVSGEERLAKPEPAFYQRLVERYDISPATSLFIDDNLHNVAAATALGFLGHHFTSAASLREELVRLELLRAPEQR